MAAQEKPENSVLSRIMLFNQHVEEHQKCQRINPFSHYSVRDMPKQYITKEVYGTPPAGSRSEQRALKAQVHSLQEILQLCELIHTKSKEQSESVNEPTGVSLKFGVLFELYNHISDKLLGTLLCARKHKYVDFEGETLFQGRDEAKRVRLTRPFQELRDEITGKIDCIRVVLLETFDEQLGEQPKEAQQEAKQKEEPGEQPKAQPEELAKPQDIECS